MTIAAQTDVVAVRRRDRGLRAIGSRFRTSTSASARGSLLAVVGPNGAGKSTLLKIMAGLLQPFSGRVAILGDAVGHHARQVAYLPQAEAVDWQFPVSVGDVVMMGRYPLIGWGRRPGAADREHVARALATVGMDAQIDRQIGALSGGQRRRVFLARAIAAEPDLYLLDEPVTGVDAVDAGRPDGRARGRGARPARP